MRAVWLTRVLAGSLLWVGVCGVALAQDDACSAATTEVQKAVCSDSELRLLDDKMQAQYRLVTGKLPAEWKELVSTNQERWLKATEYECLNKPAFQENFVTCVKRREREQTAVLNKMLVEKGGVEFVLLSKRLLAPDSVREPGVAQMEENPGFGTLHVSWLQALGGAAEWNAWNAAVLEETKKVAGGTGDPGEAWNNDWAAGTESEVKESVLWVGPERVSVEIAEDGMGHEAAHPTATVVEFHWMRKEQRLLRAEDVLVAGSAWEKLFEKRCRASMKDQYGRDYDKASGGDFETTLQGVVSDPKNWKIDADGITVLVPDEALTPHADPVNPVTVTWKELKGMVVAGFAVPK